MDPTPLLQSGPIIQLHAFAALMAAVIGTVVFLMRKGTRRHKLIGRAWVAVMATAAVSSLFINEMRMFGPFSVIHILSVSTLLALVRAIWTIRHRNVKSHRIAMTALYGIALLLTGAFTLLPGRRMHDVIFADGGTSAEVAAGLIILSIGVILFLRRRSERRLAA